jgi:glycerol-3-phosphate dehydrogenase (NAD(P)+)
VLIPQATGVILCAPSWATRAVAMSIVPMLPRTSFVLSFAKGIESGTNATVNQILADCFPRHATGVVGGPMMAEELVEGKGGIALIGVKKSVHARLRELFTKTGVQVRFSADVRGVAYAGTLKNIYAFALGIAAGAGWGVNYRGWFASQAVIEMVAIARFVGSDESLILGPAGIGDFIATAFSPHSRNRSVGEKLIQTGKCPKSEATQSILPLCAILGVKEVKKLPILAGLSTILAGKRQIKGIVNDWKTLAEKLG